MRNSRCSRLEQQAKQQRRLALYYHHQPLTPSDEEKLTCVLRAYRSTPPGFFSKLIFCGELSGKIIFCELFSFPLIFFFLFGVTSLHKLARSGLCYRARKALNFNHVDFEHLLLLLLRAPMRATVVPVVAVSFLLFLAFQRKRRVLFLPREELRRLWLISLVLACLKASAAKQFVASQENCSWLFQLKSAAVSPLLSPPLPSPQRGAKS